MISVRVPAELRNTSHRGSLFWYMRPMAPASSSSSQAVPRLHHPEPDDELEDDVEVLTDTVPELDGDPWETCSQPSHCGSEMSDGAFSRGLASLCPTTNINDVRRDVHEEHEITAGQRTPEWPLSTSMFANDRARTEPAGPSILNADMADAGSKEPVSEEALAGLSNDLGLAAGGQIQVAPTNPASDKEMLLRAASEEGKLDARGRLGNWFTLATKDDPKMKTAYLALGKNYEKQRAFRIQWARDVAENMKMTRESSSRSIELDESAGSYEPLEVIVQKEGGGPAGILAAKNYVETCLNMTREGITWRGRCLVEWNDWTKRYEVAYIKKTFRSAFERTWTTRSSGVVGPAPPQEVPSSCAAGSAAVAAAAAAATAVEETPLKGAKPEGKQKGKEAAEKKRKGGENDDESPEVSAKKKARKLNEELFQKSSKQKQKYETIAASLLQIRSNFEKKALNWDFAGGYIAQLLEAETSLMQFQKKSKFWQDWFLTDSAGLKKAFKIEESSRELVAVRELSEKINALDKVVQCVLAMHKAAQAYS